PCTTHRARTISRLPDASGSRLICGSQATAARQGAVMDRTASYPSLEDRVVFVTGGGGGNRGPVVRPPLGPPPPGAVRGPGRAASEALVASVEARGHSAPVFLPDLRDIGALRTAIAEARLRLGPIRVLINNAAHDERHEIERVTPEYWDERFHVNLRHQFFA